MTLQASETPGPDDLSYKLYQTFCTFLASLLLTVFTQAYEVGALPPTFYVAHTLPIPKTSDEDRLKDVEGYRQISLCKLDCKILANILSRRLQLVINNLISAYRTHWKTAKLRQRESFSPSPSSRCFPMCSVQTN